MILQQKDDWTGSRTLMARKEIRGFISMYICLWATVSLPSMPFFSGLFFFLSSWEVTLKEAGQSLSLILPFSLLLSVYDPFAKSQWSKRSSLLVWPLHVRICDVNISELADLLLNFDWLSEDRGTIVYQDLQSHKNSIV